MPEPTPQPPERFRWRRFPDGSGEEWSRWHTATGPCPSCCCGAPRPCCGDAVEHQEPGEPASAFDTIHIGYCETCGDLMGEHPQIERENPSHERVRLPGERGCHRHGDSGCWVHDRPHTCPAPARSAMPPTKGRRRR